MQYKCSICGYVYDEAKEGVPFTDLPENWQCPWCGAPKSSFGPIVDSSAKEIVTETGASVKAVDSSEEPNHEMQKLSAGQMAALCSNLARGCEKQYMPRQQTLFNELASYFTKHTSKVDDATVEAVYSQLQQNLSGLQSAMQTVKGDNDRGAQRAITWSEKVTRMLSILTERYQKEGDTMLEGSEIWVCTVCGFVFIGKAAPNLCPVCKVPSWKFNKIDRRK